MPHARIDITGHPFPLYIGYDENGGAHVDQSTFEEVLDRWMSGAPLERNYTAPDGGEGTFVLAYSTTGPAGLVIDIIPEPEENEGRCWPLGLLPFDFVITELTEAQGLASEGNGAPFVPQVDLQDEVEFQDESGDRVGVTVTAWYSNQKPDHRMIQIDTGEKVIVVLNEATLFEGDPES